MIDNVLNQCIEHKTLDNVTAVIIGFQSLETMCDKKIFAEPNEIQLNWDSLQKEAEEITTIIFQRVGQPLESVQEETSELCETP